MDKDLKKVIVIAITLVINFLAPILMIDMYQDYTAKSFIIGSPQIEINENISTDSYIYQEDFSEIDLVKDSTTGLYYYSYYFEEVDFDSTTATYGVFINEYLCTTKSLKTKSIVSEHVRTFEDINNQTVSEITLTITFEFYSSYSYLFITLDTDDISYFNQFKETPGLVLTLSELDFTSAEAL